MTDFAAETLLHRPALELVAALHRREVSSVELTRQSFQRIEALNPQYQAFVTLIERSALDQAAHHDRQSRRTSPDRMPFFSGIPTGVKDLNLLRGAFARMGAKAYQWLWSPIDDVTVASLRRAGFVFVGKTATSEFAILPVVEPETHGPTRNPWNPAHTAGGSSGGAASAVAAGMIPIAQGSDGGGSIRIPASVCGLVGHKASAGLLPNPHAGVDKLAMSSNGALTRTVDDTAAMLDVLTGRRPGAEGSFLRAIERPPGQLTIGYCTEPPIGRTAPEVAAVLARTAGILSDLGHIVVPVAATTGSIQEFLPVYQRMAAAAPLLSEAGLQPITLWLRAAGRKITDADAKRARDGLVARIEAWCDAGGAPGRPRFDAWLMPTVPVLAPRVGEFNDYPPAEGFDRAAVMGAFTALWNLTGRPACTVPAGEADGLPIGAQLIGHIGADAALLALARQLDGALRPVRRAGFAPCRPLVG